MKKVLLFFYIVVALLIGCNNNQYYDCQITFGHLLLLPGSEEPDVSIQANSAIGCRCFFDVLGPNSTKIRAITINTVDSELCGSLGEPIFIEDASEVQRVINNIKTSILK